MPQNSPYRKVVHITEDYLGPAAERFINRQIENHLQKSPEALTKKDLPVLINWIRLAISVLTEDQDMVDEYTKRLEEFSENSMQLR